MADTVPEDRPVILVLDDEPAIRRAAERILSLDDYTVLTAGDAQEALGHLEDDTRIDLLLCDLVLPGLSGREAANLILAQQPAMKVVFMSGYSSHGSHRQSVLDAGHSFLGKPFEVQDLRDEVSRLLDGDAPADA